MSQYHLATGVALNHAALSGLGNDDHSQYFLLAGRAGGQSGFGSPTNGQDLTLAGNPGANPGFIRLNSPVIFGPYTGNPSATYGFDYSVVDNPIGAFIGGGLNFSGTISMTNGTFIYESFRGAPVITTNANPGFAAYTVLQALPAFHAGSGAGHNPISPLAFNIGLSLNHAFTGTRTVVNCSAINFASTARTTGTGTLNVTNWTGITVAPKWSTSLFSTVNFGTIRGVWMQNPSVAPFGGSSAGTETMTAFVGLEVDSISSLGGSPVIAAVRSGIAAGTNRYFLVNNGGANSLFGNGNIHFNDARGVLFGNNVLASDASWSWQAAGYLRLLFAANSDELRWSNPANNRYLIETNAGINGGSEVNIACSKFSLGAQTGAVGNQVGVFVAGATTVSVGGEFSQFLLTQGGALNLNAAMSGVFGWTINAPAIILGTGTCTTAGALNVGGNVTEGSVNRFGIRVLSNPTGGSGVNAALWITAGISRFDGFVDINKPVALGGGAAATLGTIGGSGPATAAQNEWIEVLVNGNTRWIPAWA